MSDLNVSSDKKACTSCREEKPTVEFGRKLTEKHGSKICKTCNRLRSAKSYARKSYKVYIESIDISLKDSNRRYFALNPIKHNIPFLLEDTYNQRPIIAALFDEDLKHSFEILEVHKEAYLEEHERGQFYRRLALFDRLSPGKDAVRIADTCTNLGFKVLKELEIGAQYDED